MRSEIREPIVVLGVPRSGTTILYRCLSMHEELWHLPAESHAILEGPLHPSRNGYDSNRATADDAREDVLEHLRHEFYRRAINLSAVAREPAALASDGGGLGGRVRRRLAVAAVGIRSRLRKAGAIRFLEKTPKNCLRVPFLERLFPGARYVWIRREATTNVDSLIAGWHAVDRIGPYVRPRFAAAGYPIARELGLRDYPGRWWKFALVPEWRSLRGAAVADVAAWQYTQCNRFLAQDLAQLDQRRVRSIEFEAFVREPLRHLRELLEWAELPPSRVAEAFAAELPRVNETGPRPGPGTDGLRHAGAVHDALDRLAARSGLPAGAD